jgi:hypothetical protein
VKDGQTQDGARYTVFIRTWWKENPEWPNGLEPHAGTKHHIAKNLSLREAIAMCSEWNVTHKPGRLSRKAEFTQQ